MQNITFGENSTGGKWSRRVILRVFVPLGTLATGVHMRVPEFPDERVFADSGSEHDRTDAADDPGLEFQATAYCDSGTTKSGVPTTPGIVAADPEVLPLGSIIHVDVPLYRGIYQVMDTGRLVKGNIIDIYIPDYDLAAEFGRRKVKVTVVRYGFSESEGSTSE